MSKESPTKTILAILSPQTDLVSRWNIVKPCYSLHIHLSHEKNTGWLGYMENFTTQL